MVILYFSHLNLHQDMVRRNSFAGFQTVLGVQGEMAGYFHKPVPKCMVLPSSRLPFHSCGVPCMRCPLCLYLCAFPCLASSTQDYGYDTHPYCSPTIRGSFYNCGKEFLCMMHLLFLFPHLLIETQVSCLQFQFAVRKIIFKVF